MVDYDVLLNPENGDFVGSLVDDVFSDNLFFNDTVKSDDDCYFKAFLKVKPQSRIAENQNQDEYTFNEFSGIFRSPNCRITFEVNSLKTAPEDFLVTKAIRYILPDIFLTSLLALATIKQIEYTTTDTVCPRFCS